MFTQWSLDLKELAERAVFQQPATYFTDAALHEHWRALDCPCRKLRRRPPAADLATFRAKQDDLRQHAVKILPGIVTFYSFDFTKYRFVDPILTWNDCEWTDRIRSLWLKAVSAQTPRGWQT